MKTLSHCLLYLVSWWLQRCFPYLMHLVIPTEVSQFETWRSPERSQVQLFLVIFYDSEAVKSLSLGFLGIFTNFWGFLEIFGGIFRKKNWEFPDRFLQHLSGYLCLGLCRIQFINQLNIFCIICLCDIWCDCIRFDVWNRCRVTVVPLPSQIHLSSARQ